MASKSVYTYCLRAMRQQFRLQIIQQRSQRTHPFQRTFVTSTPLRAGTSSTSPPAPPRPRDYDSPSASAPGSFESLASTLRSSSALRSTTEPYIAYGGTEDLFLECSRQCSYTIPSALSTPPMPPPTNAAGDHLGEGSGWWLESKSKGGLGLEPTFNSWAQVLYLHMWMLTVRLRCFPEKYVKDWHQNLLDHFFYAAEDRMATWHGMAARSVRNKNLKDLWLQWRGVQLGYDEGLIKGDAVLAAAIWRNVFKASPDVDLDGVAVVTAYTMRELQRLGNVDDARVVEGRIKFGDAKSAAQNLLKESASMRQRFTESELKASLGAEK